jgi:hypothetical protein
VFYVVVTIGNGIIAAWYASSHQMPWVAAGVGLLGLVTVVVVIRILKRQYAPERDG